MHDEQSSERLDNHSGADRDARRIVLDFFFILVVALIVVAAFISALGYEFISARTPIVIMVPLCILIGTQVVRAKKALRTGDVWPVLSAIASGNNKLFNRTITFIGWMLLLLVLIVSIGHYAAIAIVMFLLLKVVSKERLVFSLLLTTGITVVIFLLFELGFDIELHRGMISRLLAGGARL